jgi:hypothetical protein
MHSVWIDENAKRVPYRGCSVPDLNPRQIFLERPDGVTRELNYILSEREDLSKTSER